MPCKTCDSANGLVVCLFCGHAFCGSHRSERDGVAACTACQEAEHARSSGRRPGQATSSAADSSRVAAIGTPVSDRLPGVATVKAVAPPQPLPEPGWLPLLAGAGAGAVTGVYLWFFLTWLLNGVDGAPLWARPTGTSLGALFAFGGVWIIVKSRLS